MSRHKLIGLFLTLVLCCACGRHESIIHQQKMSQTAETIEDLFYQAYYLRSEQTFPEICRQMNQYMISPDFWYLSAISEIHEEIDVPEIVRGFVKHTEILRYSGPELSIFIDAGKVFVNRELSQVSEIGKIAERYLFHPDKTIRDITLRKYNIDFFGEVELPFIPVTIWFDVKEKNGLSVDEWRLIFDCIDEVEKVFAKRMNEIASEKWNKPMEKLSVDRKNAVWEMSGYNLNLFFVFAPCRNN